MLLFFMEASAWAISGKSFSYEFTWHLSINTLHHGMAGYERTTIAVLFYLMASSIIIGFLHRNISSCTNKKLGCVVNRFVLYYANVKKGCRENGECIRTT